MAPGQTKWKAFLLSTGLLLTLCSIGLPQPRQTQHSRQGQRALCADNICVLAMFSPLPTALCNFSSVASPKHRCFDNAGCAHSHCKAIRGPLLIECCLDMFRSVPTPEVKSCRMALLLSMLAALRMVSPIVIFLNG